MKINYFISCLLSALVFASYSVKAADEMQASPIGVPPPPPEQQMPVKTPAENLSNMNGNNQQEEPSTRKKMVPKLPPEPAKNVIIDQGGSLRMVPQNEPVTRTPAPAPQKP